MWIIVLTFFSVVVPFLPEFTRKVKGKKMKCKTDRSIVFAVYIYPPPPKQMKI